MGAERYKYAFLYIMCRGLLLYAIVQLRNEGHKRGEKQSRKLNAETDYALLSCLS